MDFANGLLFMAGIAGVVYFMTRWALYGADNKGRRKRNKRR
jgi:hypothetical protein